MTPSIAGAQIDKPLVARRDWRGAFAALRKLMANKHDTEQVFVIMSALNADEDVRLYKRLLTSRSGGQVAYRRVELAEKLMDQLGTNVIVENRAGAGGHGLARGCAGRGARAP